MVSLAPSSFSPSDRGADAASAGDNVCLLISGVVHVCNAGAFVPWISSAGCPAGSERDKPLSRFKSLFDDQGRFDKYRDDEHAQGQDAQRNRDFHPTGRVVNHFPQG